MSVIWLVLFILKYPQHKLTDGQSFTFSFYPVLGVIMAEGTKGYQVPGFVYDRLGQFDYMVDREYLVEDVVPVLSHTVGVGTLVAVKPSDFVLDFVPVIQYFFPPFPPISFLWLMKAS